MLFRSDFEPRRWVINFFDWEEEMAKQYPECYQILLDRVYPERTEKKPNGQYKVESAAATHWWRFARPKMDLMDAQKKISRFLVCTRVTKYLSFTFFSNPNIVFTDAAVVLLYETYAEFAVLQSNLYEGWARKYSSTMKNDLRFAPSDCFENFPFPRENTDERERTGKAFYELRAQIIKTGRKG